MGQTPDDIREEIEGTRARTGNTVEAIGYKADVKSRVKESVADRKDSIVGSITGGRSASRSPAAAQVRSPRTGMTEGMEESARRVGLNEARPGEPQEVAEATDPRTAA